jgi:4,5-DOPA dioxygenase extradiol
MPRPAAVFVSHGAPTLVVDPVPAHDFLRGLSAALGKARAVLCVSAHWEAKRPTVTGSAAPGTIHDFGGFPDALYAIRYPAPGDPALARRVATLLAGAGLDAAIDAERGLDHGAWVPLSLMAPAADRPVVQLSVQSRLGPAHHLALGTALRPLRDEGILILGSGGATHDLRAIRDRSTDAPPPEETRAFDDWLAAAVVGGDAEALLDYERRAPAARRNHPTPEHFLPLFVPLGAAGSPRGRVLHRSFTYGVLSMAAFAWD